MAIENLNDIIDAINNGPSPQRVSLRAALVNLLNAGDLADLINASTRPKKEQLAIENGLIEQLLGETTATAAQVASDAREFVALAFIESDIKPLLTDPTTGDYLTQHAQILGNIDIINDYINENIQYTHPDSEHREEQINLRRSWHDNLKTLKQQHAQGIIT